MSSAIRAYVRRHHVGLLALFVALGGTTAWAVDGPNPGQNTVGSEDIIGNEVKSDDIGNGRIFNLDIADEIITGAKLKNATVTGDDVDESTLQGVGQIVNVQQGGDYAHGCSVAGEWRECGKVQVNVPANETYKVMIDSAGSFGAGNATNRVEICSSVRPST